MGDLSNLVTNFGLIDKTGRDEAALQNQRDYEAQARALGIQRQQTENETLPDWKAAQQAKLGLSRAQDTADTSLVAPKTKLASTTLGTDQAVANEKQAQLPTFLGMSADNLKANANKAKATAAESGVDLENLPDLLQQARTRNAVTNEQQKQLAPAGLGYAMTTGDNQAVLNYANKALKASGHNTPAASFLPEQEVTNKDGTTSKVVRLLDAQGNTIVDIPHAAIHNAMTMMTPPVLKEIAKGGKLAAISPLTGQEISSTTNYPDRWKANPENGSLYDEATGETKPGVGGQPEGPGRKQEAHVDERVKMLDHMVRFHLTGSNTMATMDPATQERYDTLMKLGSPLVRSGVNPDAAFAKIVPDAKKSEEVSKKTGGNSDQDFSNLWKRKP